MTTISFSLFKDKLVSGEKTHTIRQLNIPYLESLRKNGIQIYWKQRTKQREKLYDAVFTGVKFYQFNSHGEIAWEVDAPQWDTDPNSFIDPPRRNLSYAEKLTLARKDGFKTLNELNVVFQRMYGKKLYERGVLGLYPTFMGIEWVRVSCDACQHWDCCPGCNEK